MSPFQSALLAIEISIDALHEANTESARDALAQIGHLGFDTRSSEDRKPQKHEKRVIARRSSQPTLFVS